MKEFPHEVCAAGAAGRARKAVASALTLATAPRAPKRTIQLPAYVKVGGEHVRRRGAGGEDAYGGVLLWAVYHRA